MKTKYILTLVMLLFVFNATAQQGINYKAMIKNAYGDAIANTMVTVQFTILENGTTDVFKESHTPTTDANGILIVNIGEGTIISGDFNSINWGSNPHYLNTKIDSGNGLTDMGTTKFKPVPDALSARVVGSIKTPSDTSGLGQRQYHQKTKTKKDGFGNKSRTVWMPRIINTPKKYIYKYVRDVNKNVYPTILVGNQIWMAENLRSSRYNDGSEIESEDIIQHLYSYNNTDIVFYDRDVVVNGKLCPIGWHIPTNEEWDELANYLIDNGNGYQGNSSDIAKSLAFITGWDNSSIVGTVGYDQLSNNSTGFSGIPNGFYLMTFSAGVEGPLYGLGASASWWTSTAYKPNHFLVRTLSWNYGDLRQRQPPEPDFVRMIGYCVRCIKD